MCICFNPGRRKYVQSFYFWLCMCILLTFSNKQWFECEFAIASYITLRMNIGNGFSSVKLTKMLWYHILFPHDIAIRMYKDIERIPLFHDLAPNNGSASYFQFDEDSKIMYTYSHNHHKRDDIWLLTQKSIFYCHSPLGVSSSIIRRRSSCLGWKYIWFVL